jgi:hypothetical protein
MALPRFFSLLTILAVIPSITRSAFADDTQINYSVNQSPHRISAELGVFALAKEEGRIGPSFGLGYAYRALRGLEIGGGLRYLLMPAHTPSYMQAPQILPDGTVAPPQPAPPDPAFHFWLASAAVRGYLNLDSADRFELGLTARAGLLAISTKSGPCCVEGAFTPDLRVRLAPGTALQLAPEIALGTTGNHNGPETEDYVDVIFLQYGVWLSVVQAL